MGKEIIVRIELPDQISELIENDEIIRDAVKTYLTREVVEKIMLAAIADSILKDKGLGEEEVLEIDRVVKKGIRKRLESNNKGTISTDKNR